MPSKFHSIIPVHSKNYLGFPTFSEHPVRACVRALIKKYFALQVMEVPKTIEESRLSFKLRRTSFLRDSNFNYNNNDVVDV